MIPMLLAGFLAGAAPLAMAMAQSGVDRNLANAYFSANNPVLTPQEKAAVAIARRWRDASATGMKPVAGPDGTIRYLRNIISYLLSRREKDYHLLGGSGFSPRAKPADALPVSTELRHSITACLYFLPPHRMKQADLVIMAAISQLVSGAQSVCWCQAACVVHSGY